MAIKEYADTRFYTMGSDADILYLFGGQTLSNNGVYLYGGSGVGNDKDNVMYGTGNIVLTKNGMPGDYRDGLTGGAGNDRLFGYLGNDALSGGDGNDRLDGGGGGDWLDGGAGNDTIIAGNGDNIEWVYYTPNQGGVWTSPGTAQTTSQYSFDRIYGGEGDDLIYSDGYDEIYGGVGNDRIVLPAGESAFIRAYGDEGNDRFIVSGYTDAYLYGGDGTDTVVVRPPADVENSFFDMFRTAADIERLVVRSTKGVKIIGRTTDDQITGGMGNDTIISNGGKDRLAGNDGDDELQVNGLGRTNLFGGAGADTFYFGDGLMGNLAQGADDAVVIQDFEDGVDKIRVSYDMPDTTSQLTLQGITVGSTITKIANTGQSFGALYKQAKAVHGTAGGMSLAYFEYNGNTYVVKDNSVFDTVPELSFKLVGVHDFSMSDFIISSY